MLVITRHCSEGHDTIYLGDGIKIQVVMLRGETVRIGIEAPQDVKILRGEIADEPLRAKWARFEQERGWRR